MPVIQAPDGKVIQFPDDMPEGQIVDQLNKLYPGPAAGSPAGAAAPTGSAGPAPSQDSWQYWPRLGYSSLFHGLASGFGTLNQGVNWATNKLTGEPGTMPDTNQILDYLVAHKVPVAMEEPKGPVSNVVNDAVGGAAAALPLALYGGPETALLGLSGGAGGGVTSGVVARNITRDPITVTGAGLLGGLATQGGVMAVRPDRLERALSRLSPLRDPTEVGSAIQTQARQLIDNTPMIESRFWNPVNDALHPPSLPAGPSVPLTNLEQVLQGIRTAGGTLAGAVRDPAMEALERGLDRTIYRQIGVTPTWDEVMHLKTALGNAYYNKTNPLSGLSQEYKDQIYGAIKDDLREAARSHGGDHLADMVDEANNWSTILRDRNVRLQGYTEGYPEDTFTRVMAKNSKGPSRIEELTQSMPEAAPALTAAQIRMDPGSWSKMSDKAKAALVPDAGMRRELDHAVEDSLRKSAWQQLAAHMTPAYLGGEGGAAISEMFHTNPLVASGLGALAGSSVPMLYRAAGGTFRNIGRYPELLAGPAGGALGAQPQLYPVPPQR